MSSNDVCGKCSPFDMQILHEDWHQFLSFQQCLYVTCTKKGIFTMLFNYLTYFAVACAGAILDDDDGDDQNDDDDDDDDDGDDTTYFILYFIYIYYIYIWLFISWTSSYWSLLTSWDACRWSAFRTRDLPDLRSARGSPTPAMSMSTAREPFAGEGPLPSKRQTAIQLMKILGHHTSKNCWGWNQLVQDFLEFLHHIMSPEFDGG